MGTKSIATKIETGRARIRRWRVLLTEVAAHLDDFSPVALSAYEVDIPRTAKIIKSALNKKGEHFKVVDRMKKVIGDTPSDNISLPTVARRAGVSPFHACRIFKQVTGINFTDYINKTRIEASKRLLCQADSNLTVFKISTKAGFKSVTHFNRVFKALTGLNPREYRAYSRKKSAA